MHVLGPSNIPGAIPKGLELGDVILVSPVQPKKTDGLIFTAQRLAFPEYDAAFVHAAIYIGGDHVVDAIPGADVGIRSLDTITIGNNIRALRLIGIGPAKQWDIADAAQDLSGKYNYVKAAADAIIQASPLPAHWKSMLADIGKTPDGADYYYCSHAVAEVYAKVLQVPVLDRKSFVPLPAAFSASPHFADAILTW
jgi:hypothetical protein